MNQPETGCENFRGEANVSEGGLTALRYFHLKENGGLEQQKQKAASL
jgi:hypothetical protein